MSYQPPDRNRFPSPMALWRSMRAPVHGPAQEAERRSGMAIRYGPGVAQKARRTFLPRWVIGAGIGLFWIFTASAAHVVPLPHAFLIGGAAVAAVTMFAGCIHGIGLVLKGFDRAGALKSMKGRALEPMLDGKYLSDPVGLALARTYAMPDGRSQEYLDRVNDMRIAAHHAAENGDMRGVNSAIQAGLQLNQLSPLPPGAESPWARNMREFFDYLGSNDNWTALQVIGLIGRQMAPYDQWAREQQQQAVGHLRARYAPEQSRGAPQYAAPGPARPAPGRGRQGWAEPDPVGRANAGQQWGLGPSTDAGVDAGVVW